MQQYASRIVAGLFGLVALGFAIWWFAVRDPFDTAEAMFERGEYVSAYQIYLDMANDGDARAQFAVSRILEQGLGANIYDPNQSLTWLRRSAQGGYAYAQLHLGDMFADGAFIAFDAVQAEEWWGRAADQNLNEAWPRIYGMYTGLDPAIKPRDGAKEPRESDFTRLKGLSDRGEAWAKVLLARFAEAGYLGDDVMALQLYQEAADAGSAEARYQLSRLIAGGEAQGGVGEAQALLLEAAEVGHGPAAGALAESLVETDPARALFWTYVARKSEDPRAAIDPDVLEERIARIGADEAKSTRLQANEWRPKDRPPLVRAANALFR